MPLMIPKRPDLLRVGEGSLRRTIKALQSWVERISTRSEHPAPERRQSGPFAVQIRVIRAPALAEPESSIVASPFLESTLLSACPGLRESWNAHRRTFGAHDEPDDRMLFDAVRRHVVGLLAAERVAEFSRFARALERLIGEADPILYDLVREGLLRPLANDLREASIEDSRLAPYLGARTSLAWPAGA